MTISRRYSNDLASCEDTFQECFIQIYKSLVSNKTEIKDLDSWIARIAINTNITSYYKAPKADLEEVTEDLLDESHKAAIDKLSGDELMNIIQQIPDGYRVIFNLYFMDGYKHKEIAELLNISESTSRSQLARAKDYLRKKLESQGIYRYEST